MSTPWGYRKMDDFSLSRVSTSQRVLKSPIGLLIVRYQNWREILWTKGLIWWTLTSRLDCQGIWGFRLGLLEFTPLILFLFTHVTRICCALSSENLGLTGNCASHQLRKSSKQSDQILLKTVSIKISKDNAAHSLHSNLVEEAKKLRTPFDRQALLGMNCGQSEERISSPQLFRHLFMEMDPSEPVVLIEVALTTTKRRTSTKPRMDGVEI